MLRLKMDAFPIDERRVMIEQIATPYGNVRENLRRTLQRNKRKGLDPPPRRLGLTGRTRKGSVKTEPPSPDSEKTVEGATETRLPVHTSPRPRLTCSEPIRTLVFMDLSCTHIFPDFAETQRNFTSQLHNSPSLMKDTFKNLLMRTKLSDYPRITEMSFISVPREVFVRGHETIQSLTLESPEESFVLRLSANVRTCQINPELTEDQWCDCDDMQVSDSSVIRRPRRDLELKHPFAKEWPAIRAFLDECTKPVCLVSHNGVFLDYRVLYGELLRCGFIEKGLAIPNGVVFVDSVLAIREMDKVYCEELIKAMKALPLQRDHNEKVAENSDEPRKCQSVQIEISTKAPEGMSTTPTSCANDREVSDSISVSRPNSTGDQHPCSEHPLRVMNMQQWSAAKIRRVCLEFFRPNRKGMWEFNVDVAKIALSNYHLSKLYEMVVKTSYDAYYTQDDAEALMQVCVAYGRDFLDYVDHKSCQFPWQE